MWYNNRLYRLLVVIALYALGALGAAIVRVRADAIRSRVILPVSNQILDVFSSWLMAAAFLPLGTLYYLGGWGGWGAAISTGRSAADILLCSIVIEYA